MVLVNKGVSDNSFIEVPCTDRWQKKRARFLFRERRERYKEGDEQLTASQEYGVISQERYQTISGNRVVLVLTNTDNFLHVDKDNFVISLRTFEGGIERVREPGCVSPAYTVMQPSQEVVSNFFQYVFKSRVFISILQTTVTGIREGKSVKYQNFADIVLPLPNKKIQKSIANFLDRETARIDKLIEKKEKLILLLIEKRISLIRRYVTRGLVPNVEMKDSGVEWIGEIPKNWQINKFKHLFRFGMGETILKEQLSETGIPVLSATEDYDILGYYEKPSLILDIGDIVISARGSIGFVKVVKELSVSTQTTIYGKRKKDINTKYVKFFCDAYKENLFQFDKTAIPQITVNQVKNNTIIFPDIDTQNAITDFLNNKTARFDKLIEKTKKSIELLKEFRSSLITEAVTGHLNIQKKGVK